MQIEKIKRYRVEIGDSYHLEAEEKGGYEEELGLFLITHGGQEVGVFDAPELRNLAQFFTLLAEDLESGSSTEPRDE